MKLLERLRLVVRRRGMADATADAYISWVSQYLHFSRDRHGAWRSSEELHTEDVEAFLNHLVMDRRLSASSQNQALNALVFLYSRVLADAIPQDHLG
jgi:site-specific recombinase XerD